MTRDESESKMAGPGHIENLRKFAARAISGAENLVERATDAFASKPPPNILEEVSEAACKERDKLSKQDSVAEAAETDVFDGTEAVPTNLPTVVTGNAPATTEDASSGFHLPYFSIEPLTPKHVAQLFVKGTGPQPFDSKLSYRIRPYTPPEETVLHYLFQGVNQQLKQFNRPVRLLLLQPIETSDGHMVPPVQDKVPITSVCVHLPPRGTSWMEIRPVSPKIREAGVKVDLGQPAVLKIRPPAPAKGFFEAYVLFLHDRRRPVRLSTVMDLYMAEGSVIRPLSQQARNYYEAQKSPLLALLPKAETTDVQRPPEYEPFPLATSRKREPTASLLSPAKVEKEKPQILALSGPAGSGSDPPPAVHSVRKSPTQPKVVARRRAPKDKQKPKPRYFPD